MCGRFAFISTKEIKERFETYNDFEFDPNYNIAPSFRTPVITRNSPNKIELMKWGLIPFWAKDPKIGFKLINARSEGISSKPSFREPFKKRRCLVPADGFYEWQKTDEKKKQPYYLHFKDDRIFAFAGLYDIWKDAEDNEIKSYTIITTLSNKVVSPIHNRMPVILKREDEDIWLNNASDEKDLLSLLKPLSSKDFEAYKVSAFVNSPRNNSEECVKKSE